MIFFFFWSERRKVRGSRGSIKPYSCRDGLIVSLPPQMLPLTLTKGGWWRMGLEPLYLMLERRGEERRLVRFGLLKLTWMLLNIIASKDWPAVTHLNKGNVAVELRRKLLFFCKKIGWMMRNFAAHAKKLVLSALVELSCIWPFQACFSLEKSWTIVIWIGTF